jgi:hypothetical protein
MNCKQCGSKNTQKFDNDIVFCNDCDYEDFTENQEAKERIDRITKGDNMLIAFLGVNGLRFEIVETEREAEVSCSSEENEQEITEREIDVIIEDLNNIKRQL